MKKYAYIEWLSFSSPVVSPEMAEDRKDSAAPLVDGNLFANANYRWLLTDDTVDISRASYGNGEELLAWLSVVDSLPVLIIPGEKVVVRQVPYLEKQKRHFAKMLPYEIEDDVIDEVENLHFAIGEKNESQATIAYIEREWFKSALDFFKQQEKSIERAFVDFQCLQREPNEFVVWFDQGRLLAHGESGIGFSTADGLADEFLINMFSAPLNEELPERESEKNTGQEYGGENNQAEMSALQYKVYVSDNSVATSTVEKVTRISHTINPSLHSDFYDERPILSLANSSAIDFCTGIYAPKKSDSRQVNGWKLIGVLSLFSVLIFLSANFLDVYLTKKKIIEKSQAIVMSYRQVIPEGVVRDPVRSLRNKLEQLAGGDGVSSEVVQLLSRVAPVVQSLDINLLTINYSHKEKVLRLSIQASSFNIVEKLRTDIEEQGLAAELLSSNAIDDKFQARLRISKEKL